jgi:WhiB family redox-sensing transcriptional regulator
LTRRLVLRPDEITRVRRDVRFRAAQVAAVVPDPQWRVRGSCVQTDPGAFFPEQADQTAAAVAMCGKCAVSGHCLAAALATAEPEGVWGGTTPAERRRMRVVWTGRC